MRSWLTDAGFDIVDVPGNRLFVTAAGTVADVERTFDVSENMYRIDGTTVRAPDADPAVPAQIAPYVRAITGLDGSLALATPEHNSPAPPPPAGTSVGPCSRYWGERTSSLFPNPYAPGTPLPWLICGYTPAQIDSAYGVSDMHRLGLDGRGQTIAITGAFFSPTLLADANSFSHEFGLPPLGHGNYRERVAPGTRQQPQDPAETQSWYIEQALDVEWAHAVAPGGDPHPAPGEHARAGGTRALQGPRQVQLAPQMAPAPAPRQRDRRARRQRAVHGRSFDPAAPSLPPAASASTGSAPPRACAPRARARRRRPRAPAGAPPPSARRRRRFAPRRCSR